MDYLQLNTHDLSNQASKDYVFDIERFTSFEGNTGPYILYTIVRIKSILSRYAESGKNIDKKAMKAAVNDSEKALMLELSRFNSIIAPAFEKKAPHRICSYIYDLANAFNSFIMKQRFYQKKMKIRKHLGFVCNIDRKSIRNLY